MATKDSSTFVFDQREDKDQIARVQQAVHATPGVEIVHNATSFFEVSGNNASYIKFLGEYQRLTDLARKKK